MCPRHGLSTIILMLAALQQVAATTECKAGSAGCESCSGQFTCRSCADGYNWDSGSCHLESASPPRAACPTTCNGCYINGECMPSYAGDGPACEGDGGSWCQSTGRCSQDWCRSPADGGGHDCWAGNNAEYCSCSQGGAQETGKTVWSAGFEWWEYTCCTDQDPVEGDECGALRMAAHDSAMRMSSSAHHPEKCREGRAKKHLDEDCCGLDGQTGCADLYQKKIVGACHPGLVSYECHDPVLSVAAVVVLCVVGVLTIHVSSLGSIFYLKRKAQRVAAGIPQCGPSQAPANAVDITSDYCTFESSFTGMGRADMMPNELRQFMNPQEFEELFTNINQSLAAVTGFRCWHLLLWAPMILFWVLGGFMIMIWGIQRTKYNCLGAIGVPLEDFVKKKSGLSYAVILGEPGGKHSQGRPSTVRFFLNQSYVVSATVVGNWKDDNPA